MSSFSTTPRDHSCCPVCECVIKEATSRRQGQDAVECSGVCSAWLHRQCAGLSRQAFSVVSSSDQPFFCPNCRLDLQEREHASLRAIVTSLKSDLEALKSVKSVSGVPIATYAAATANTIDGSGGSNVLSSLSSRESLERNSSLVVFGIDECPAKTPRHQRICDDTDQVVSVLSSVNNDITTLSVRDCFQLGKFQRDKHRPLLVKMNSVRDVSKVLANRFRLAGHPGISVKANMSAVERKVESVLLKVRWDLIHSGIERKSIKLRANSLYVNNVQHGSVMDFKYVRCVSERSADNVSLPASAYPTHDSTELLSDSAHQIHSPPAIEVITPNPSSPSPFDRSPNQSPSHVRVADASSQVDSPQ